MVADIQRIKTTMLRQGLDNLYLSNNPQKVLNPTLVNLDDVTQSIPGGIIRADDVNAIRYEKHPFVFAEAMQGFQMMNEVAETRTGVNRYFNGTDANALNKTAAGVQTLSTMAAQRVEQIARIMGASVEDLARIVHELILKGGHKKEVVQIRGEWHEVDPATWKKRTDFRIAVAFSAGNKDAMVGRLQMMAAAQLNALQLGLPIVKPENIHATMVELAKAADFSSPERFWTDPTEVEPQQQGPNPDMLKIEADMTAKQADLQLQEESAKVDAALREKELLTKAELEKYKIDTEASTKLTIARMSHEQTLEQDQFRAQLTRQAESDKDEKEEARSAQAVEATATLVQQQTEAVAEMLQQVLDTVNAKLATLKAPRRIRRDKSGRAEAVEIIGPDGQPIGEQSVMRGPDGRVIGVQ
jgi:hypothetical protein